MSWRNNSASEQRFLQFRAEFPIEELQKRALRNPSDYEAGLALYQKQMQENKIDDASVTVRRFTSQPNAPAYFHFLEAESWAEKGNWERAWQARQAFDAAKPK